jgi:hypothetical protein
MCPNPEISKPIRFYVDTRASWTTIAGHDAIRLGLDYAQLQQSDLGFLQIVMAKMRSMPRCVEAEVCF